jgi:hypothetical protein
MRRACHVVVLQLLVAISSHIALGATPKGPQLEIAKGNMSLGANAAVNYFSSDASFYGGFYGQIVGSYAYFVQDGLAVGVTLSAASTITRLAVAPQIAVGALLEYVFKTQSIAYPYLGAGVAVAYKPLDPSSMFWLPLKPQVGVLIALSDAVALDLGMNTTLTFALAGYVPPLLDGSAGFIGVRAFF